MGTPRIEGVFPHILFQRLNLAKPEAIMWFWAFFIPTQKKEVQKMMHISAKPTWQWASKNTPAHSPGTRTSNVGVAVFKQAILPRSLDLAFSLKYRR